MHGSVASFPVGMLERVASGTVDPASPAPELAEIAALSPRRRALILVAMTGSLSMIMMDTTVVGVALAQIGRDLGLGESQLAWVVNAYLLALAALIALGGRIGDLVGKNRAFTVGVTIFALASLLCGLATSGSMLIAARVLQAVGAVLMQPASGAIVISTAAPGREGRTMGIYIGISMLSLAIGPVLGGIVTDRFGGHWIFFINLPIAAIALVLAAWARPPAIRSADRAIDAPSIAMLVVSLPLLVGGIQEMGSTELGRWTPYAMILGGLLGLLAFLRRQGRVANPVLQMKLLRDRGFLADAAMLGLMQFALTGTVIQLSVLLQSTFALDPEAAGYATLPLMLPVLLFVQVSGRLYDRFGVRRLAIPAAIAASGAVVLLGVGSLTMSMSVLVAAMFLLGCAIPFVNMPSNTDGMRRIGPENRGQASGVLQTFRMFGSTLGIAFMTAMVGAVGRREVDSSTVCEGVDAGVVERAGRGDLGDLATLVGSASDACVEFVRTEIARGIGWGFVFAGLVASLATVAAIAWRPSSSPASSTEE